MKKDWEERSLGDICEFRNGLWKGKKPPFIKAKVIRMTNFTKDCEMNNKEPIELEVEKKQFESRNLTEGDLLIEKSGGGPNQPVGRVVRFKSKDNANYSFSNFTTRMRIIDQSNISSKYLHKFFKLFYLTGKTEKFQKNSTNIRNLQLKDFKEIQIPLPSIQEQKRIVEKLDTCIEQIDKAIKNVEQNIQNAENLFQSYLNEIFSKFDKSLIVDLSQLADIVSGQSPKSSNYNVDKKGLPFYQGKKLFNDKFISKPNTWTTHTTKVSIGGDILMSVRAPVGDVNINSVGEICIGRGLAAIRPNELLNREFLFYFLVYFKDKLSFNTGATINSINRKQISQIGVPKIELHEQSKIAENINLFEKNLYQSIKNYGNEILALNELKQSILEKAFNGEL